MGLYHFGWQASGVHVLSIPPNVELSGAFARLLERLVRLERFIWLTRLRSIENALLLGAAAIPMDVFAAAPQ